MHVIAMKRKRKFGTSGTLVGPEYMSYILGFVGQKVAFFEVNKGLIQMTRIDNTKKGGHQKGVHVQIMWTARWMAWFAMTAQFRGKIVR